MTAHLLLGVELRLQVVEPVLLAHQELVAHELGMDAEDAVEYAVVDERTGVELFVEGQPHLLYFLAAHGQRRTEVAHRGIDGRRGNLPHAEESDDVVDAEGIEILLHPLEAAAEILVDGDGRRVMGGGGFLLSITPSIGGESPVLSVGMIDVGWRSRLHVEIEEFGVFPSLHAVAAKSDGEVAFQRNAFAAGIVGGFKELDVQVILNEIVEFDKRFTLLLVGIRAVALHAEFCIVGQPVFVLGKEGLEGLAIQHAFAIFLEGFIQVGPLHAVDGQVVAVAQGIQFPSLAGILQHELLVANGQLVEVDVVRMQGKCRDDVIGM